MSYFPPTGSVVAFQSVPTNLVGTVSVVSTIPASVSGVGLFNINPIGSGSVIATLTTSSVAVLQGTNPWVIANSSVMLATGTNVIGSVATLQGTNPWVIGNSSVMLAAGINTVGSIAVLQGTNPWITTVQANSIAGTYAEDSAHTSAERGLFTLGVRNDTVASFASANLDYTPYGVDSAGRVLIKPFAPNEAYVSGVSSTVNTNPSSLLAVAGTGLRNYVTDIWVANTGSVATLVTFRDGDASVIGKTIAPAGGGSNLKTDIPMRTGGFNQPVEYTANVATSILHVSAFGYIAP